MEKSIPDSFDDEEEDEGDAMDGAGPQAFAYLLNDRHHIRFQRRGPALLVSFEVEPGSAPLETRPSRFDDLADEMDWSTLALTARGDTWFRDAEVINFFDALADGTLLDRFDHVLFYGQGTGGHAALSFALTAPDARVLALAAPAAAGLPGAPREGRIALPRGIDLAARYGVTAENLVGTRAVWLLFDPNAAEDRAHVDALSGAPVTPLACRNMGWDIETGLVELGLLDEMVVRAMEGDLERVEFYRALRVRRDEPAWLRRLIGRLIDADRPLLEALAVRNVAERTGRHRFTRRFEQIAAELLARGVTVPPSRNL